MGIHTNNVLVALMFVIKVMYNFKTLVNLLRYEALTKKSLIKIRFDIICKGKIYKNINIQHIIIK